MFSVIKQPRTNFTFAPLVSLLLLFFRRSKHVVFQKKVSIVFLALKKISKHSKIAFYVAKHCQIYRITIFMSFVGVSRTFCVASANH